MAKKDPYWMSIDEKIVDAGWFPGTERDWKALPTEEKERLAFEATGCLIAYPTWHAPVNCLHPHCRVKRNERPWISLVNGILKDEMHGNWLRFQYRTRKGSNERNYLARLCVVVRNRCREAHVDNPWDLPGGWMTIVYTGVLGAPQGWGVIEV